MFKIDRKRILNTLVILTFLYFVNNDTRTFLNDTYTYCILAPWHIKLLILFGFLFFLTFTNQILQPGKLRSLKLNNNVKSFKEYDYKDDEREYFTEAVLRIIKEEKKKGSSIFAIFKRIGKQILFILRPAFIMILGFVLAVLLVVAILIIFKR